MNDEVTLRRAVPDDVTAICELLELVFHDEESAELRELEAATFEPERSLVAEESGAVVGHTNAYSRELTVPGAVVPAAHVSSVGVAPTHRRRGLLTRMMHRQLREVAEAGHEPIAVLWASETSIYPRFGYGPAASRLRLSIMNRELRLPAPPAEPAGRLRLVDRHASAGLLEKVYEELRPDRVGWSSRSAPWWRAQLADPQARRDGATLLRCVVHEASEGPTGYALWRAKDSWNRHGPDVEVQVREVVAADPETYQALWRFLLGIDLTRRVTYDFAALDEPLQYLVDEPRRLGRELGDALWVRVVDVPAALAARRYATELDIVLEVTDPVLSGNNGRWRLTGGPGAARCVPTGDPADLACTVTELGAAYLGATSLTALAAAGRVRELTPHAAAAVGFGWHRQPCATEVF